MSDQKKCCGNCKDEKLEDKLITINKAIPLCPIEGLQCVKYANKCEMREVYSHCNRFQEYVNIFSQSFEMLYRKALNKGFEKQE